MPTYTFRLPANFPGKPVTVHDAATDAQATSGTTDSDAVFTADLAVGDYYAKVTRGRMSHTVAGEVDRGDLDWLADGAGAGGVQPADVDALVAAEVGTVGSETQTVLSSTYARRGPVAAVANWPTPFYIAHRGNALLAPEESLSAYRMAVDAGAHAIELDLRLLADGTLVTMHDATIDRTTGGTGNVADMTAARWSKLRVDDASGIIGTGYLAEPPPTAEQLLREFGNRVSFMAQSYALGSITALAELCDRIGVGRDTILIMTNIDAEQSEALGLGFEVIRITNSTAVPLSTWAAAGVNYVAIQEDQVTGQFVTDCHALGLKVVPWSVNSHYRRDALTALAVDGFISDDTAYLAGNFTLRRRDAFAAQAVTSGHHLVTGSNLGSWFAPSTRRFAAGSLSFERLGYIGPADPNSFTLEVDVTPRSGTAAEVMGHIWIGATDYYHNTIGGTWDGYLVTLLHDGKFRIESMVDGARVAFLGYNVETGAMVNGTKYTFRFTITPTQITWLRVDSGITATYTNSAVRPLPYVGIAGYISATDFDRVEYVA